MNRIVAVLLAASASVIASGLVDARTVTQGLGFDSGSPASPEVRCCDSSLGMLRDVTLATTFAADAAHAMRNTSSPTRSGRAGVAGLVSFYAYRQDVGPGSIDPMFGSLTSRLPGFETFTNYAPAPEDGFAITYASDGETRSYTSSLASDLTAFSRANGGSFSGGIGLALINLVAQRNGTHAATSMGNGAGTRSLTHRYTAARTPGGKRRGPQAGDLCDDDPGLRPDRRRAAAWLAPVHRLARRADRGGRDRLTVSGSEEVAR